MKLMSDLGYDAATIGNDDFDGGIDGLETTIAKCHFPFWWLPTVTLIIQYFKENERI